MNKIALTAAAALLATGFATPLMAQSASAPAQIMIAAPAGHSVNKYYKQSVYDPAKEKIGTIDDVIASDDGQIQAFIIGVGGFLGMGEKNVAVPYRSVHAEFK
ncbi:MAG TPA: PRC-barrel domain-containing protein, partial [Verrucomicrobiae bacterium]|nr:PRC-barrel domain-containing protein [Verrucomicrobiae bacterium]